jgi:hypothetical protein
MPVARCGLKLWRERNIKGERLVFQPVQGKILKMLNSLHSHVIASTQEVINQATKICVTYEPPQGYHLRFSDHLSEDQSYRIVNPTHLNFWVNAKGGFSGYKEETTDQPYCATFLLRAQSVATARIMASVFHDQEGSAAGKPYPDVIQRGNLVFSCFGQSPAENELQLPVTELKLQPSLRLTNFKNPYFVKFKFRFHGVRVDPILLAGDVTKPRPIHLYENDKRRADNVKALRAGLENARGKKIASLMSSDPSILKVCRSEASSHQLAALAPQVAPSTSAPPLPRGPATQPAILPAPSQFPDGQVAPCLRALPLSRPEMAGRTEESLMHCGFIHLFDPCHIVQRNASVPEPLMTLWGCFPSHENQAGNLQALQLLSPPGGRVQFGGLFKYPNSNIIFRLDYFHAEK